MKIVFLGTPDFALPSLQMLIDKNYDVLAVFTQPDKAVGRKQILQAPPVKTLAEMHGIPVFQPKRIRDAEWLEQLRNIQPDLMITAAFGQILSKENLDIPKLGCINVHGSLLPKYRGAAPIQWALVDGLEETGITTMFTSVGIDTGDILLQKKLKIDKDENAGELFERMASLGAETLHETLIALENGSLERIAQNEEKASHCAMIKKSDAEIDWQKTAQSIHNLIRGMNPWPTAFTRLGGETLKVWRSRMLSGDEAKEFKAEAGEIVCADEKKGLIVMAGDSAISIEEIQAAGSKRMPAKTFLRGHNLPEGRKFD